MEMVVQYDQLHMVTYNPSKFEQNSFSGIKGVAFTKCSYSVAISPVKFVEMKWGTI